MMNETRIWYGLVKINHMYYAVLGDTKGYESKSIDIFDSSRPRLRSNWKLKKLTFGFSNTSAVHYQGMIYASGTGNSRGILEFNP